MTRLLKFKILLFGDLKMKKFVRNSLALATLAVMATGFAGVAQAGSLAYSNLNVLGLKFLDGNNDIFVNGTNITVLNFLNSTTNSADLDSVAGVDANTLFNTQVCQGSACGGVGGFGEQAPIGTQHFTRAISDLSGTIIDGLGAGAAGATAQTVAETQLIKNDKGIANSNIQLNAGFDFTLTGAGVVGFTFDTTGGLHAMQNPENNVPPSNAQASVNLTITIIDNDNNGDLVFSWSPDGKINNATLANDSADDANLNDTLPATFAGNNFTRNLGGAFSATSLGALTNGVSYSLAINHTSDVQAASDIPEPGSLALLGLGLLGLGARKFRRS
jgi:hypothetical protein